MGRYKRGESGNPQGRARGVPNKVTGTVKEWIASIIDGNRQQFEEDLKRCAPTDRLRFLLKLLDYVLPKQAAVQAKIDFEALTDEQVNDIIGRLTGGQEDEDCD